MTINIQIRKDSRVTYTEAMILALLEAREQGEEINITVYPGGVVEAVPASS